MNITAYTILNLAALLNTLPESASTSNPYLQGAGIAAFFIGCNYVRELLAHWRNPYEIVHCHDKPHRLAVLKNGKSLKRREVRKIGWDTGFGRQAIERFISTIELSEYPVSGCGYEMSGPLWNMWQKSFIHEKIKELLTTQ
jgi:hypothetical protein